MTWLVAVKVVLETLLRALLAIVFVGFVKRPLMCCTDVGGAEFRIDLVTIASGVLVYAALMTPMFLATTVLLKRVTTDAAIRAFAGGALGLLSIIAGLDVLQSEHWVEGERWMPLSYLTVAASGGAAGVLAHWIVSRRKPEP